METALNNLLTRARLALINSDLNTAKELFKIASIMIDAMEKGENENTTRGQYLIEYSKGMHR